MAFLQLGKTWNLIPKMPGKCILALEFSNFYLGEAPRLGASRLCPFSEVAPPTPEILHLPLGIQCILKNKQPSINQNSPKSFFSDDCTVKK
jgi:hypothetical protein